VNLHVLMVLVDPLRRQWVTTEEHQRLPHLPTPHADAPTDHRDKTSRSSRAFRRIMSCSPSTTASRGNKKDSETMASRGNKKDSEALGCSFAILESLTNRGVVSLDSETMAFGHVTTELSMPPFTRQRNPASVCTNR
jgi:hypothetical protein